MTAGGEKNNYTIKKNSMANIRKDGWHDERHREGKFKNKRRARKIIYVGLVCGVLVEIGSLITGDGLSFNLFFGAFVIGAVICGLILRMFRY